MSIPGFRNIRMVSLHGLKVSLRCCYVCLERFQVLSFSLASFNTYPHLNPIPGEIDFLGLP